MRQEERQQLLHVRMELDLIPCRTNLYEWM